MEYEYPLTNDEADKLAAEMPSMPDHDFPIEWIRLFAARSVELKTKLKSIAVQESSDSYGYPEVTCLLCGVCSGYILALFEHKPGCMMTEGE